MICRKCEKDIQDGSQFCPHCGTLLTESPVSKAARRTPWLLAVAALIVIAGIAVALALLYKTPELAQGTIPPTPPSNLVRAPVQNNSQQLVQGPKSELPAAPVIAGTTTQPKAVPQDVVDYLAKLKAIEDERKKIANDSNLAASMMQAAYGASFNPNDDKSNPTKDVQEGYHAYIARLQALSMRVRRLPTPQSCLVLANSYLSAVQNHIGILNDLRDTIQKMDVAKAMAMQQGTGAKYTIGLKTADDELTKLCNTTGADKTFSVADQ